MLRRARSRRTPCTSVAGRLHRPPGMLTAADLMTRDPVSVSRDIRLIDAVAVMVEHRIRHLPVVDGTTAVIGMLSDRDILAAIREPADDAETPMVSPADYRVCDVMMHPAITASSEQVLRELARLCVEDELGVVPIVDGNGMLVGIVSCVDVLHALVRDS
jgi:CBS-domain-containing membrane protein